MSPLTQYESSHSAVCSHEQKKAPGGLVIVFVIRFQKIFQQSGTMAILLHLINNR